MPRRADGCCAARQSVAANRVAIRTTNAPIRGTFNASSALLLETANAPIVVRANLVNGAIFGEGQPTVATLRTANG